MKQLNPYNITCPPVSEAGCPSHQLNLRSDKLMSSVRPLEMAEKEETAVIKVTVPRRLHDKLRKISQQTGVPMSSLLVMAAVKEYKLVDEGES